MKMKFFFTYQYLFKHSSDENKGNDHQGYDVLIFRQILLTSSIRNVRRTVRRISGLKGLIEYDIYYYYFIFSHHGNP